MKLKMLLLLLKLSKTNTEPPKKNYDCRPRSLSKYVSSDQKKKEITYEYFKNIC